MAVSSTDPECVIRADVLRPEFVRDELTAGVRSLMAPGGTLLAIQAIAEQGDDDGPPWPLARPEIEAFGKDGLSAVSIEELAVPDSPGHPGIWRAEFRRA